MDTFVILSKYTPAGRKYANPDDARKRWEVIAASLQKTLNGKPLALRHPGELRFGGDFSIPPGQQFQMFQCLIALQAPGDVEITVMPAWDFDFRSPAKP